MVTQRSTDARASGWGAARRRPLLLALTALAGVAVVVRVFAGLVAPSLVQLSGSAAVSPADLLTLTLAGAGAVLSVWLGLGFALAALAALPGTVGLRARSWPSDWPQRSFVAPWPCSSGPPSVPPSSPVRRRLPAPRRLAPGLPRAARCRRLTRPSGPRRPLTPARRVRLSSPCRGHRRTPHRYPHPTRPSARRSARRHTPPLLRCRRLRRASSARWATDREPGRASRNTSSSDEETRCGPSQPGTWARAPRRPRSPMSGRAGTPPTAR